MCAGGNRAGKSRAETLFAEDLAARKVVEEDFVREALEDRRRLLAKEQVVPQGKGC